MTKKSKLTALVGAALTVMASSVGAGPMQVLLNEDFQDVTGMTAATTVRTVASILTDSPMPLDGSPVTSFSNTGNGNASATAFNVRRGNNAIDGASGTPTLGNANFDNFFGNGSNRFLVIGDNSGNLGSNPNGGSNATATSTMSIRFALDPITLTSPRGVDIWFDWVFDANNSNNVDDLVVDLILADTSTVSLLNIGAPTAVTRGTFNAFLPMGTLAAAPAYLDFRLVELSGNGSSAVGLDNIQINAIPEPAGLALLGIGLMGMGLVRCKKP